MTDTLWQLRLFGKLEVKNPTGESVLQGRTKAALLCAYLALSPGTSLSREKLAEELWPETDTSTKRTRLRQEIALVRTAFAPSISTTASEMTNVGPFVISRTTIVLQPHLCTIDVVQFTQALANAGRASDRAEKQTFLLQAVAFYTDDLLTDFPDDFQTERRHFAQQFEDALFALAQVQRQLDAVVQAIATLRRLIARDPLREEAHLELMRLYARSGQVVMLRRQYQEFEQIHEKELGEALDPNIKRLFQDLLKEATTRTLPAPEIARNASPSELPPPDGSTVVKESSEERQVLETELGEPPLKTPEAEPPAVRAAPASTTSPKSVSSLPAPMAESVAPRPSSPVPWRILITVGKALLSGIIPLIAVLIALLHRPAPSPEPTPSLPPQPEPSVSPVPPPPQINKQQWAFYYKPRPGELIGAQARALYEAKDGSLWVTGLIQTEREDPDMLTLRLSPEGKQLSVDRYSSPEHNCDRAFSITGADDGSIYVAGETYVPVTEEDGDWYLTVIKYSPTGKRLWVRRSPDPTKNFDHRVKVVTIKNQVYVAGTARLDKRFGILLLHYAPDGQLRSKRIISEGNGTHTEFVDLTPGHGDTLILTGTTTQTTRTAGVDRDWLVACFDWRLRPFWKDLIDGGIQGDDHAEQAVSERHVFAVAGGLSTGDRTQGGSGISMAVANYNENGIRTWTRISPASGPASNVYRAGMLNGETVVCCQKIYASANPTVFIARYDPQGNRLWETEYRPPSGYSTLHPAFIGFGDGGTIVFCGEMACNSDASSDVLIARFSFEGQLITQHIYSNKQRGSELVRAVRFVKGGIVFSGESVIDTWGSPFMVVKYRSAHL